MDNLGLIQSLESKTVPPQVILENVTDVLLRAIQQSPQIMTILSPVLNDEKELVDFRYVYLNNASKRIFIHNHPLMENERMLEYNPDSNLYKLCERAYYSKKPVKRERFYDELNLHGWYRVDIIPVENNLVMQIQKTTHTQSELREVISTNTLLDAVLGRMSNGFILLDERGRVVFINKRAENFLKISKDALNGKNIFISSPFLFGSNFTKLFEYSERFQEESRFEEYYSVIKKWLDIRIYPSGSAYAIFIEDITERKNQEQHLLRLSSAIASSHDAIIVTNIRGVIFEWNLGAEELYHFKKQDVIGKNIAFVFPEGTGNEYRELYSRLEKGEKINSFETKRQINGGKIIDVSITLSPIFDEREKVIGVSAIIREITELKKIIYSLAQSEKRFRNIIVQAPVPILIYTNKCELLQISRGFLEQSGYAREDLLSFDDILSKLIGDSRGKARLKKFLCQDSDNEVIIPSREIIIKTSQGAKRHWDINMAILDSQEDGSKLMMAIAKDITKRLVLENMFVNLAYTDSLTGLMNRTYFNNQLKREIKLSRRNKSSFAVMFLDIDNFKAINDTLGHRIGDVLLKEVGMRLNKCISREDLVTRQGGDEFTFIIKNAQSRIEDLVNNILTSIRDPLIYKGKEIHFSGSIGVSFLPGDANDAEHLLIHADKAMYTAKHQGGNQAVFFSRSSLKYNTIIDIPKNFQKDCFMTYQVVYEASTNTPDSLEALMAYIHDDTYKGGDSIMESASSFDSLGILTDWNIKQICKEMRMLPKMLPVSINISILQLNPDLINLLLKYTKEYGIPHEMILCEIPADEEISRNENILSTLRFLHTLGFKLILDRFGEKSSSVTLLTSTLFTRVKISKQMLGVNNPNFLQDLNRPGTTSYFLHSTIKMLHAMGILTIGVGVESEKHVNLLQDAGCDLIQGYHLHKPAKILSISRYMNQRL